MYNPYQQYKQQSLSTLTPAELVLKLFDEAVKQIRLAMGHIEKKDLEPAHKCLTKTEDIITALKLNLDKRYPISEELEKIYNCIYNSLVEANMKKDAALLNEVLEIVMDLRDTFSQANKLSKIQNQ